MKKYKYVSLALFIAGIIYVAKACCNDDIFMNRTLFDQVIIHTADKTSKKSSSDIHKDQMMRCLEQMDYHFAEGCKCLEEAKDCCIFFPNTDDQEKALVCLNNINAVISCGDARSKAIGAILSMATQYTFFVIREWQIIDNRLTRAKYHFEMEEHYRMTGKYIQKLYIEEKAGR